MTDDNEGRPTMIYDYSRNGAHRPSVLRNQKPVERLSLPDETRRAARREMAILAVAVAACFVAAILVALAVR